MVVVVLVVLGVGDEARPPDASAAPAKTPIRTLDDQMPPLKVYHVQSWLTEHQEDGPFAPGKRDLVRALSGQQVDERTHKSAVVHAGRLGSKLGDLIRADLAARAAGREPPYASAADLTAALRDAEKHGHFDHAWTAYLWRRSAELKDPEARVELFARLRQRARITDALIRAQAQVKPLMQPPRAWMSKAGPRPADRPAIAAYQASLDDLVKAANQLLPTTDEGTWKRDGIVQLKLAAGTVTLVRGGKEQVLEANAAVRFGRLDLLKTGDQPAAIAHDWLGKIELPANRFISVWELPSLLSPDARQKLDEAVLDALKNNSEESADRLERCLAISHAAIRAGLKELPTAKGAPRLRLILSLFDDVVMPSLRSFQTEERDDRGVSRRGAGPRVGR
jgi:hypothetical protein